MDITPKSTFVGENGSHLETPAEIRMYEKLGGDVVGENELLVINHVDPTLLTRLGIRLGFTKVVCNKDEFLSAYHQAKDSFSKYSER